MDDDSTFVSALMDEALDAELDFGGELPEVWQGGEASLSPAEVADWRHLRRLHLMLRAQAQPELPMNFSHRTMARLAVAGRSQPDWRITFLRIGAIMAGLATALLTIGLAWGGALWSGGSPIWRASTMQVVRSLGASASVVGASVAQSPWVLVLYGLIAGSMAALWFLVLIWPRLILRAGKGRST